MASKSTRAAAKKKQPAAVETSESIAEQIDQEVRSIVAESYDRARQILCEYRDRLDAVAERLLEVETVTREEFEELFPAPVPKNGGTPVLVSA